jgi:hypothetical protein
LGGSSSVEEFFNNPTVKEVLHAPAATYWQGCIPGAGRRRLNGREKIQENRGLMRRLIASFLEHDRPQSTVPYIAELLDGGVRVMAYNGDRDLSCNAAGTERLLNDMQWSGADEWYATKRGLWAVNNEPAGYAKSLKGLDFVVVYNSGHLVPVSRILYMRNDTSKKWYISQQFLFLLLSQYNQPLNAFDLITRFLKHDNFSDFELPSFDFSPYPIKSYTHQKNESRSKNNFLMLLFAFGFGLGVSYLLSNKRRREYRQVEENDISTVDEMTGLG